MFLFRLFLIVFLSFGIASCSTENSTPSVVGTGTYPNSIYTSTESKPLQSAVFGAATSPVQIKIFSDYQCPACINFHEALEERLWKEYIEPKKLTVTFYNYPLTLTSSNGKALHQNAEGDALAGLCALSFGKFHEFRTEMYKLEEQKAGDKVTDDERISVAKKVGITDESFGKCLTGAWYQKTLESEIDEGNRLNLRGTPSVYLNDKPVNFKSADELFLMLDAAIKKPQ